VNDTLARLARDRDFQEDLRRPLVRVGLGMWAGEEGRQVSVDLEAARLDEGYRRIVPRMEAFEKVCDAAKIKFPGGSVAIPLLYCWCCVRAQWVWEESACI